MTDFFRGTEDVPVFLPHADNFHQQLTEVEPLNHAHRDGRCIKNRWVGPQSCTYRGPDLSSPEALERWLADG